MIPKFQTPSQPLKITDGKEQQRQKYKEWSALSWTDQMKRRLNIAKIQLNRGPAIPNVGRAILAAFGGYDPQNPDLNSGTVPTPSKPVIPKGYTFVRKLSLRNKDGLRIVHQIKDNVTGKFRILEDLNNVNKSSSAKKTVNLSKYKGEKLSGNEPGFDNWALSLHPESDHFPDLSHGVTDPREVLPIINREFESLPNGTRVDLGKTFSGDISANLLQFVRRNKNSYYVCSRKRQQAHRR